MRAYVTGMTPDDSTALEHRRRRLLFRATHRGTKLTTLGHAGMAALAAVMELQDTDLTDWLTGRVPIPPEADSPMLREILAFVAGGGTHR